MLQDVRIHRRFSRLNEQACAELSWLGGAISRQLPDIVDGFYEHLDQFELLRRLLDAEPGRRARLKRVQIQYFEELLGGCYDANYAERRRRVGQVHFAVGLMPEWYIGAYAWLLCALLPHSLARGRTAIEALFAVVGFDMGLTLSAYDHARLNAFVRDGELAASASRVEDTIVSSSAHQPTTHGGRRANFFDMRADELAVLSEFADAAEPVVVGAVDAFYQHLDHFPQIAALITDRTVAERLLATQRAHWRRFFRGARDEAYREAQYRLGLVHSNVGLPLSAYLSALMTITNGACRSSIELRSA